MKTLYDLLGARPVDDADRLRTAFRKAAKANHPDLHAGDPYAPMRFRQIVEAYDILRDAERRATYDRLLRFERERLRWKLKRTVSYLVHSIVFDAITAVGLAIVLAGGYVLFAHSSKTPIEELVGLTARGSARIAAVQPAARTSTTGPGELRDRLERAAAPDMIVPSAVASAKDDSGAAELTKGGPASSSATPNTEVAKIDNVLDAPMDQAGQKTKHLVEGVGIDVPARDQAQSVEVQFSSVEIENGAANPLSDFAMSDDKRDMKLPDPRDISTSDVKTSDMRMPEIKIPGRPRMVAKRQATGRATFEQASLENRNTCSGSQSCSRDVPPLFGVGF